MQTPERVRTVLSPTKTPLISAVLVSPGRSPTQGNLTGPPRKVKDTAADWHNYIQKWEDYNIKAMNVISEISNIKLKSVFTAEGAEDEMGHPVHATSMPAELEGLCETLVSLYDSMAKVVAKFSTLTAALKGVCELEKHQNSGEWDPLPLFQTWPTHKFYEVSSQILQQYEKELILKKKIVENVAHTTDRDMMMFYSTAWLHQPYIDNTSKELLESMLLETGLK